MNNKGSIIISFVFLILVVFLTFTLLHITQFHTQIQGARMEKISRTGQMTEELIYYIHRFRTQIFEANLSQFQEPEKDYFNKDHFPDCTSENDPRILINNAFSSHTLPKNGYSVVNITNTVNLTCSDNHFKMRSILFISLLCGEIPITLFPFFIDKDVGNDTAAFLRQNGVTVTEGNFRSAQNVTARLDTTPFLAQSIGIGGSALTWSGMREKFGLPISDDPIEDGIHRVIEGDAVSCIFIQGDVNALIFYTEGETQFFTVIKNNVSHHFSYVPGQSIFNGWEGKEELLLFKERIIVNGNILNLSQNGTAAFNENSQITLYASGQVVIFGSLETDFLTLTKIRSTNLTLICTNEKLFSGTDESKTGVTVTGAQKTDIRVSVITDGAFRNKTEQLNVYGGIHCAELSNEGKIDITSAVSGSSTHPFFKTHDYKCIGLFRIKTIEEVSDEDQ